MAKILTNHDIFKAMEKWAPIDLAYEWDNVGLQVGSYSNKVKKAMITLDVLESVVDEAIENEIDLIIAHHPPLFKAAKNVDVDSVQGRVIQKLIQNNITVYASHTNLDVAKGGVSDILCEVMGINETDVLISSGHETLYKFVVYTPTTHLNIVRETMGESGAGHIGNYSHCTFQTEGTGTFKPLAGTNPYIGEKGETEFVPESKIETIVSESNLSQTLDRVKSVHPYEEVAYDIFPLSIKGEDTGAGRIGVLSKEMTLQDLCEHVKKTLNVPMVRVTGELKKQVKKVAVLGGSGSDYVEAARKKGADVYITGDMSFHEAQDAWQKGLSIIDPGHHVEKVMKQATKDYLENIFTKSELEVSLSDANTEPFQFV
ncbi:Nif3-like dinuclear metal center hexameric protein [Virgibacillus flavescens]|uniref:Nif3-like dinuclear metal center hexameric protein n=1 Tax=Virgibacillus flavescens TaxID=1611422 RepID=UPI003D33B6EE